MPAPERATLFLRLEGPLQAWGDNSRFVIRRTRDEPTRSGVIGLLCAALGRRRADPIADLAALSMGVRVDRAGSPLRDYHTVGAKIGCMSARGEIKHTDSTGEIETCVSLRYYLADASFLVALQGPDTLVALLAEAVRNPAWPLHLGRKSCPPSRPVCEGEVECHASLDAALAAKPWRPRLATDTPPGALRCVVECSADCAEGEPRPDFPLSFKPRRFAMRFVREIHVQPDVGEPTQTLPPPFGRPRQRYQGKHWRNIRSERAKYDDYRCVFCGLPSLPIHHVTYERANQEEIEDLRSLCRICHDAVTMVETERGMSATRIDPLRPEYRASIIRKRDEILTNRRQPPAKRRP